MELPWKRLRAGVKVPVLGLGTWKLQGAECREAVRSSWEAGYRHFDTAAIYKNHAEVAEGLRGFPRDQLFLVSKLWHEQGRPEQVEEALNQALLELQVDYLDLYLVHWPNREYLPDVLHVMEKMRAKGKLRASGVCNATVHHLQDALDQGVAVEVNQVELHPFLQQPKLAAFCEEHQIALTAYSPLARGEVICHPLIMKIAQEEEKTAAQIALAWSLQKGHIVIPKASSFSRMQENAESVFCTLSSSAMQALQALDEERRLIHPDFAEFAY